jgi:hypothetical protein
MEKNIDKKIEIENGLNTFFDKFEKNDEFTKIFLEIVFENLIKKNEKKP